MSRKSLTDYRNKLEALSQRTDLSIYGEFVFIAALNTLDLYLETGDVYVEEMSPEEREQRMALDDDKSVSKAIGQDKLDGVEMSDIYDTATGITNISYAASKQYDLDKVAEIGGTIEASA